MKKYIPLKLRQHIRKPKSVKMPIRKVLKKDESEAAYYREVLMLMAQTATFQAEMLLDHEISIHERLLVQNTKNQLDKILDSVMGQLPEDYKDLHYDRMHFLIEMVKLSTLIPPRYYEKMQAWMVERIESIHGIKSSKK
jgi:hypothetical protein